MERKERTIAELMDALSSCEPAIKVVLPYDRKGDQRRLVLANQSIGQESPLKLSFRACFLDFRENVIKICLDEDVSVIMPLKGTYHFELIPTRRIPQLTTS